MESKGANGCELVVLTSLEEIKRIVAQWHMLYAIETEASSVFLSPAWIMPWLLAQQKINPYFICIYHKSQLVALAPLMIENLWGFQIRSLRTASFNLSQYQDLALCEPQYKETMMKRIVEHIIHQKPADFIELLCTTESALIKSFPNTQTQRSNGEYSSVLDLRMDLPSMESKRTVKKSAKKEADKNFRKLSKSGKLCFSIHNHINSSSEDFLAHLFKWKKMWLEEKAMHSKFFHHNENFEFAKGLLSGKFNQVSTVKVAVLSFENKPIAMVLGLVKTDTFHSYLTAYNPEFKNYSPGTILFSNMLGWMEENGLTRYDFLAYPEAYKGRFSNTNTDLFDVWLPLTLRGKIAVWIVRKKFPQRIKTLFYFLPSSCRKLVLRTLKS